MLFLTLIIIVSICPCEEALKILKFHVPSFVESGSDVKLTCIYDLNDFHLYSVKWFKGETEFYSYIPKSTPQIATFNTEGINIDLSKSNSKHVYIRNVRHSTEGLYRCEISGEYPKFPIDKRNNSMKVFATPKNPPTIAGNLDTYRVGDVVRANCTSAKSRPGVILTWYINEKVKKGTLLEYVSNKGNESESVVSVSMIQFVVEPKIAQRGRIILTCRSSLPRIENITKEIQKKFKSKSMITLFDAALPGKPFTSSSSGLNKTSSHLVNLYHITSLLLLSMSMSMACKEPR